MTLTPSLRRPLGYLVHSLALWLAAMFCCSSVLATPGHIVEQAFVTDPGGQMTLEQAMRQPQTVYSGALVRSLEHSVVWVRLHVVPEPDGLPAPPGGVAVTQRLRVIPMWYQSLSLYDPLQQDASGRIRKLEAGPASAPFSVSTMPILEGAQARDLWLRLQPNGPCYVTVALMETEAAAVRTVSEAILLGVIVGLYAMMILLGVIAWMMDRRGIGKSLLTKQVFNLLLAALNADLLMLPDLYSLLHWSVDGGSYAVECLRLLNKGINLWFFIKVLELLHVPRWALQLQRLPLAVLACCFVLLVNRQLALVRTIDLLLYPAVPIILLLGSMARENEPLLAGPGLARRCAQRMGFGLLLAAAWAASLTSGVFKTQEFSFFCLVMPIMTFGAVGMLVALGWRRFQTDRQRQVQMAHRAELNALALDFERSERQRQQEFMTMLTHELKAPLSTLGMVIGSPVASATMRRHAMLALTSMHQVISHCAQSAEIDGDTPTQRVACSLPVTLQLRCDALAEKARIVVAPTDDMPLLLVDPRMLSIIFNNLLDNALKYSPAGSPISVTLLRIGNPEGAVQELRVSNQPLDGPLPDALRLFQKYYRGDAVKRISGSGLGLYLSRLLARRMGGDLQYQAVAHRVTFTLVLPEQRSQAVAPL